MLASDMDSLAAGPQSSADARVVMEELVSLLQTGVAALTEAFESRTSATLATSSHIEESVDRLEMSLKHAMIDLQLLTHSSFVETSAHEPDLPAVGPMPSEQEPEACSTSAEQTWQAADHLEELLGHVTREDVVKSLNLPHVYGSEHFLQDADVGINVWHGRARGSYADRLPSATTTEQGASCLLAACA